jgi:hypothetical protein
MTGTDRNRTSLRQIKSLATSANSVKINNRVYVFGTLGYTITLTEVQNKIIAGVGKSNVSVISTQNYFVPIKAWLIWQCLMQVEVRFQSVSGKHRDINLVGLNAMSLNLLNPNGHVMHQQFNIQQLYALPTLYLRVLYLTRNKQRLVPLTA